MNIIRGLHFTRDLEKDFLIDYNDKSRGFMRVGLALTIILYGLFGILDLWMTPYTLASILFIRFAIVIPMCTIAIALTYLKRIRRWMQPIISLMAVVTGMGIVAMLAIVHVDEPAFKFYFSGVMLVVMGIYALIRLRFLYAVFSATVIIAGYLYTAVCLQRLADGGPGDSSFVQFISNSFFILSANIIGAIAAYSIEKHIRNDFLQRQTIQSKQKSLEGLMVKIKRQLDLAQTIQANLLPRHFPEIPGIHCAVIYRPMEELGGDFYDFISFPEPHLVGIFISDVSGHGVPAALITGMIKALTDTAGNAKYSPAGFMRYVNARITGQIGCNFITALYAVYNSDSMSLTFSRAGHTSPVLVRDGKAVNLESGGKLLGFIKEMEYEDNTIDLRHGDKVLFYTDGLVEAKCPEGDDFEEALFSSVLPALSGKPVREFIDAIFASVVIHRESDKFTDDVCIIGIEIS
jgi:hypothetical protein